jgi:hypothetical protein
MAMPEIAPAFPAYGPSMAMPEIAPAFPAYRPSMAIKKGLAHREALMLISEKFRPTFT